LDILVDLDGTMVDPALGIIGSVQHALQQLGRDVPKSEDLHWVIGPPLRVTFAKLGLTSEQVDDGLALYRERYRAGAMYDFVVYRGMSEALSTLAGQGHRLIVATSKPHVFAKPILVRAGLAHHYAAIHGAELDGRNDDKADLIRHIIAMEGVAPANAIMIGDRQFDVLGAKANAIPCIGATWGYGSADELQSAGASALATSPADLIEAISTWSVRSV
jgi:phosphoglycolate phosphatase